MEKVIVELEAKTDEALKGIKKVGKEVEDLNKQVVESNKDTANSLKSVEKSSGQAAKSLKGIGRAIKAAGIGLLIAAFATLKDIFMQNQKAADLFNTAFEVVSIAFNDFVGFIVGNGAKVVDFFKAIFDDPLKSVKQLGESIKANIIERFESFLDTLGYLASAVKKVFSGDFAGALEDVKSAGKESLDVLTGVNNVFDKSVDIVKKTTDAIVDYTTKTIKAAKENVELAKSAELASVLNQGLIEKYDRQAEQLRQIRDDESKSINERIKANEELAKVLDEQEKAMKANAQIMVDAAAAELAKNKDNIELQRAYQEALNEQAAIEAQITGFRSEQQTNTNSLLREQKEIMNEIALIGESERDKERLELEQQYEANRLLIEREITDDIEKKERLLAAETDYKTKLAEVNKKFAEEDLAIEKEMSEAKKKISDAEAQVKKQNLDNTASVLENFSNIAGKETAAGKAFAVAASTINTYRGVSDALAATTVTPFETALKFANAAAIGVSGIANVKKILSVKLPHTRGSSPSTGNPSKAPLSVPPAFNVVGASETNQLASAIGGQSQQPIQAYVVANDVTTGQSLDRNIVDGASLGG